MTTMTSLTTGKAAMPTPGSNCALKTFNSNEDEIEDFLSQFENCCDNAQLDDSDKVEFILRYLSCKQKDAFETFKGFEEKSWPTFKEAIKESFEGAFMEKKYTRQSLVQFTRTATAKPIVTDLELRNFHREFTTIAHYLVKCKLITEEE